MSSTTPQPTRSSPQRLGHLEGSRFWHQLALMVVLNFLITLLVLTLGGNKGFLQVYEICNAIGFSIWGMFELLRLLTRDRLPVLARAAIGVPAGFVIGTKIAAMAGARDLLSLVASDPSHQWRALAGGLLVAVFATSFFVFYWRAEAYRADLQSERRRAAEALQSETEAKLALLQAQIEPHFLFNTLANVRSAIESDPGTAKSILEHLNQYLRVSLGRTRRASSTLADEINLIGALLAIAAMRLGDRLRYSIHVPDELMAVQIPPLLLQPLVENALKHGIEPSVNGGEISVQARREQDLLCLRVTDTGVGMNASSPEGVGLANVRGRLASLYGDRGRLAIYSREPHGVVAEIAMPLERV